jgi:hypothetical protein
MAAAGVLGVVAVMVAPRLERWWTDAALDSREIQVPCGQRPSAAEASGVLGEQQAVARRIEAVDPSVLVMVDQGRL